MDDPTDLLEQGFAHLQRRVLSDPALERELLESRERFFAGPPPAKSGLDAVELLAMRRHMEWFLLERESETLGGVPAEVYLAGEEPEDELADGGLADALLRSRTGLFEVDAVGEATVLARDLLTGAEVELPGSPEWLAGDLLVGRLFPVEGESVGHHRPSPAVARFHDRDLVEALHADLARMRAERRGVLRMSQLEIERMFFQRPEPPPGEAVERARAFLRSAGLGAEEAERVLASLRAAPIDPADPTPGRQEPLAAILVRLAFDTKIDLAAARRHLLEAWIDLSRREAEPRGRDRSGSPDGASRGAVRRALDDFDRGRADGRDLDELFAELERDLGLAPGSTVDEEVAPAPDFPGVVGAVLAEFYWEVEREEGADAAERARAVASLEEFAGDVGVLENLGVEQLHEYAARAVVESRELRDAEAARAFVSALSDFCLWAEERQQLPLFTPFRERLRELGEHLPRVAEANAALGAPAAAGGDAERELFEVVDDAGTSLGLSARDTVGERHALDLPAGALRSLRAGDVVRGRFVSGRGVRVRLVYPPASRALLLHEDAER